MLPAEIRPIVPGPGTTPRPVPQPGTRRNSLPGIRAGKRGGCPPFYEGVPPGVPKKTNSSSGMPLSDILHAVIAIREREFQTKKPENI